MKKKIYFISSFTITRLKQVASQIHEVTLFFAINGEC